jgi:hypothetical protein
MTPEQRKAEDERRRFWNVWHYVRVPLQWWRQADPQRRTANATVLLAGGTILLAMFSLLTLFVTHRDTARLISDARVASKQQHGDTLMALQKTDATVAAMQTQADIMRAAQRPWVKVALEIAGPLTFTPEEARVAIAFVLMNTGNSPAVNVEVHPEVAQTIQPKQNFVAQMLEICRRVKTIPDDINTLIGQTIFPGDTFTQIMFLPKRRAEIEDAFSEFQNNPKNEYFTPEIVGCVSYRFAYQNGRHVTQFIGDVRRKENPIISFKTSEGDVPASDLVVFRTHMGEGAD